MTDDGTSYIEPSEVRKLAKSFETHAYDLKEHLKKFKAETGEEAITDGFGVLTESKEVTTAYISYSNDVASAMEAVHKHLDAVGEALRDITRNTEISDEDASVLFGGKNVGGTK
jgi:uncharacterized protein YukE